MADFVDMYEEEMVRLAAQISLMDEYDLDWDPRNLDLARDKIKLFEDIIDELVVRKDSAKTAGSVDPEPMTDSQVQELFAAKNYSSESLGDLGYAELGGDSPYEDKPGRRSNTRGTIISIQGKLEWYQQKIVQQIKNSEQQGVDLGELIELNDYVSLILDKINWFAEHDLYSSEQRPNRESSGKLFTRSSDSHHQIVDFEDNLNDVQNQPTSDGNNYIDFSTILSAVYSLRRGGDRGETLNAVNSLLRLCNGEDEIRYAAVKQMMSAGALQSLLSIMDRSSNWPEVEVQISKLISVLVLHEEDWSLLSRCAELILYSLYTLQLKTQERAASSSDSANEENASRRAQYSDDLSTSVWKSELESMGEVRITNMNIQQEEVVMSTNIGVLLSAAVAKMSLILSSDWAKLETPFSGNFSAIAGVSSSILPSGASVSKRGNRMSFDAGNVNSDLSKMGIAGRDLGQSFSRKSRAMSGTSGAVPGEADRVLQILLNIILTIAEDSLQGEELHLREMMDVILSTPKGRRSGQSFGDSTPDDLLLCSPSHPSVQKSMPVPTSVHPLSEQEISKPISTKEPEKPAEKAYIPTLTLSPSISSHVDRSAVFCSAALCNLAEIPQCRPGLVSGGALKILRMWLERSIDVLTEAKNVSFEQIHMPRPPLQRVSSSPATVGLQGLRTSPPQSGTNKKGMSHSISEPTAVLNRCSSYSSQQSSNRSSFYQQQQPLFPASYIEFMNAFGPEYELVSNATAALMFIAGGSDVERSTSLGSRPNPTNASHRHAHHPMLHVGGGRDYLVGWIDAQILAEGLPSVLVRLINMTVEDFNANTAAEGSSGAEKMSSPSKAVSAEPSAGNTRSVLPAAVGLYVSQTLSQLCSRVQNRLQLLQLGIPKVLCVLFENFTGQVKQITNRQRNLDLDFDDSDHSSLKTSSVFPSETKPPAKPQFGVDSAQRINPIEHIFYYIFHFGGVYRNQPLPPQVSRFCSTHDGSESGSSFGLPSSHLTGTSVVSPDELRVIRSNMYATAIAKDKGESYLRQRPQSFLTQGFTSVGWNVVSSDITNHWSTAGRPKTAFYDPTVSLIPVLSAVTSAILDALSNFFADELINLAVPSVQAAGVLSGTVSGLNSLNSTVRDGDALTRVNSNAGSVVGGNAMSLGSSAGLNWGGREGDRKAQSNSRKPSTDAHVQGSLAAAAAAINLIPNNYGFNINSSNNSVTSANNGNSGYSLKTSLKELMCHVKMVDALLMVSSFLSRGPGRLATLRAISSLSELPDTLRALYEGSVMDVLVLIASEADEVQTHQRYPSSSTAKTVSHQEHEGGGTFFQNLFPPKPNMERNVSETSNVSMVSSLGHSQHRGKDRNHSFLSAFGNAVIGGTVGGSVGHTTPTQVSVSDEFHEFQEDEEQAKINEIAVGETLAVCYSLANLCEAETAYSLRMFKSGLFSIMIKLVRSSHMEISRQALRCMNAMCAVVSAETLEKSMAGKQKGNKYVIFEEALEVLTFSLKSPSSLIQREAATTIAQIASINEHLRDKVVEGPLRPVISLLVDPKNDRDLRSAAESVLKNLGFLGGVKDFELCGFNYEILHDWYAMQRSLKPQELALDILRNWVENLFHEDEEGSVEVFSLHHNGTDQSATGLAHEAVSILQSKKIPSFSVDSEDHMSGIALDGPTSPGKAPGPGGYHRSTSASNNSAHPPMPQLHRNFTDSILKFLPFCMGKSPSPDKPHSELFSHSSKSEDPELRNSHSHFGLNSPSAGSVQTMNRSLAPTTLVSSAGSGINNLFSPSSASHASPNADVLYDWLDRPPLGVTNLLDLFYTSKLHQLLLMDITSLGVNLQPSYEALNVADMDAVSISRSTCTMDEHESEFDEFLISEEPLYLLPSPLAVSALLLPARTYQSFNRVGRVLEKMFDYAGDAKLWSLTFRESEFLGEFHTSLLSTLRRCPQICSVSFVSSRRVEEDALLGHLVGQIPSSVRFLSFKSTLSRESIQALCILLKTHNAAFLSTIDEEMSYAGHGKRRSSASSQGRTFTSPPSGNGKFAGGKVHPNRLGLLGLALTHLNFEASEISYIIELLQPSTRGSVRSNNSFRASGSSNVTPAAVAATATISGSGTRSRGNSDAPAPVSSASALNTMVATPMNTPGPGGLLKGLASPTIAASPQSVMQGLRYIDLSHNALPDIVCARILSAALSGPLEGLELGGNSIRNGQHMSKAMELFAPNRASEGRSRLRYLGLSQNNLTIKALSGILNNLFDNNTLCSLDLSFNDIDHSQASHELLRTFLRFNNGLRSLDLCYNRLNTDSFKEIHLGLLENDTLLLLPLAGNLSVERSSTIPLIQIKLRENRLLYKAQTKLFPSEDKKSDLTPDLVSYQTERESGTRLSNPSPLNLNLNLESMTSAVPVEKGRDSNLSSSPPTMLSDKDVQLIPAETLPQSTTAELTVPTAVQSVTSFGEEMSSVTTDALADEIPLSTDPGTHHDAHSEQPKEGKHEPPYVPPLPLTLQHPAGVESRDHPDPRDQTSNESHSEKESGSKPKGYGRSHRFAQAGAVSPEVVQRHASVDKPREIDNSIRPIDPLTSRSDNSINATFRFGRSHRLTSSTSVDNISNSSSVEVAPSTTPPPVESCRSNVSFATNTTLQTPPMSGRGDLDNTDVGLHLSARTGISGKSHYHFAKVGLTTASTLRSNSTSVQTGTSMMLPISSALGIQSSDVTGMEGRMRSETAGTIERFASNTLNVLFSAPLAGFDRNSKPHPLEVLDYCAERDILIQVFREVHRDVCLHFDFATTDSLRTALSFGCKTLHFSGHGIPRGLCFEDGRSGLQVIRVPQLRDLLGAGGLNLEFVFVSACYSKEIGEAFVKAGVPHVVCVQVDSKIQDAAAIAFTRAFYVAFLSGKTVRASFEIAKEALKASPYVPNSVLEGEKFVLLPEPAEWHLTHQKHTKKDQKPSQETSPEKITALEEEYKRMHDKALFNCRPISKWPVPGRHCTMGANRIDVNKFLSRNRLPSPPADFEGREVIMHSLIRSIFDRRLVSLVGEDGVGKSAVAAATCKYLADRQVFPDSVIYLKAKGMSSYAQFLQGLQAALLQSGSDTVSSHMQSLITSQSQLSNTNLVYPEEDSLFTCLEPLKTLLVLDHLDDLVADYGDSVTDLRLFLSKLFETCPNVKLLVVTTDTLSMHNVHLGFGIVEYSVLLGPLTLTSSLRLFARLAPSLSTGQAKIDFIESLSPAKQLQGSVNTREINNAALQILSIFGDGHPAKIVHMACESNQESVEKLKSSGMGIIMSTLTNHRSSHILR